MGYDLLSNGESDMTLCSPCDALRGATKRETPHPQLKAEGRAAFKDGFGPSKGRGYMEYYVCLDCGAKWMRDRDELDDDASWVLRG
ncbi:hypothetical protein G6F32_016140 [Rhizopus arrhizus]|nr:hypothetical protein G6F32_016140 [Rhizopus arrhizus]